MSIHFLFQLALAARPIPHFQTHSLRGERTHHARSGILLREKTILLDAMVEASILMEGFPNLLSGVCPKSVAYPIVSGKMIIHNV